MTAIPDHVAQPAMRRPVSIDGLSKGGRRLHVVAEPAEREVLARRLGLLRLDRLEADIQVIPAGNRRLFRLTASLEADVVQSCVVTLEPVASTIKASLDRSYSTDSEGELETGGAVDLGPDEADPPDPIIDQTIDVGEAVVEQLALDIDPFPRAVGANFTGYSSHPEVEDAANPFASLEKLREGSSGKNR